MQENPQSNVSDTASTTLGFQLAKIAKLKRQLIDIYVAKINLCRTEWQALFWIDKLGNCTQKELLKNLEIDAGHLARVLEKLEQKKYILRARVKENRRCLFIQLTSYCRQEIIPQILTAMQKEEDLLLDKITAHDKKLLIQSLFQIEQNVEAALNSELHKKESNYE